MALVFVIMGLLGTLPGLIGYAFDAVRNIEDIIPDHDAVPTGAAEETPQDEGSSASEP